METIKIEIQSNLPMDFCNRYSVDKNVLEYFIHPLIPGIVVQTPLEHVSEELEIVFRYQKSPLKEIKIRLMLVWFDEENEVQIYKIIEGTTSDNDRLNVSESIVWIVDLEVYAVFPVGTGHYDEREFPDYITKPFNEYKRSKGIFMP